MTRRRITIAVIALMALIGTPLYIHLASSESTSLTLGSAVPVSTDADEPRIDVIPTPQPAPRDKRVEAGLIAGNLFYNCPQNDDVKQTLDTKLAVPCGTDLVEVSWVGETAEAEPTITWIAGQGSNNFVTTKHDGAADIDGMYLSPKWYVQFTIGEGSELMQVYRQTHCGTDFTPCWAPVLYPNQMHDYYWADLPRDGKVALVFSNGKPGVPVPGEWWGKDVEGKHFNYQFN